MRICLYCNLWHALIQEFSLGGGGGGGGGVQVSLTKKSFDNVFFFFVLFFLVLSLFYRCQMVKFKEIYRFSRFQRGSNIFQGGSNFFQGGGGGSNCLFPIETHITCDFPGGVRTPCPHPLDPHLFGNLHKRTNFIMDSISNIFL